ncbi:MAG: 50S ribosomal protein L11 [Betaproteobacteria bacterium]|nr:50S ribosomal protein L11 [Betaproteobacteria bacterium]
MAERKKKAASGGKKLAGIIKLQVPAGAATPAPPLGPALGQRGLNIADFVGAFNAATAKHEKGVKLPVVIRAYEDRTYDFVIKSPAASVLILKALGAAKGSGKPHTDKIGKLTRAQAEEIAKEKMQDLNANDIDAAVRIIAGSARSMGVEVEAAS